MSDNKPEYDAQTEALNYGSIWTNSLFERDGNVLKISRGGGLLTVRILWASIIWGSAFALIAGLVGFLIFVKILGAGMMAIPFIFGGVLAAGMIGVRLGRWSPIQKETGEDLMTYMKMKLRKSITYGGLAKRPSTTTLNSLAIGGEEGRLVQCQQWLGTQPLHDAPPMSAFEDDFKTDFDFYPRGEFKVAPSRLYSDGLPERF